MGGRARRVCIAAAVVASPGALLTTADAQSLALSFSLGFPNGTPYRSYSAASVDRCAALSGSASLVYPCRVGPLVPVTSSSPEAAGAAANLPAPPESGKKGEARVDRQSPEAFLVTVEGRPAAAELPMLGSPPKSSVVRVVGGREALTASLKTVDLMLRVGSKYRLKSSDDGWELYKFSDSTYENRLQNTMKAIGIEVLVPFQ